MPVITKKILENLISLKSGRLSKFCVGIPEKVLGFAEHLCAQQRKTTNEFDFFFAFAVGVLADNGSY